jgi:hypothetical protein
VQTSDSVQRIDAAEAGGIRAKVSTTAVALCVTAPLTSASSARAPMAISSPLLLLLLSAAMTGLVAAGVWAEPLMVTVAIPELGTPLVAMKRAYGPHRTPNF